MYMNEKTPYEILVSCGWIPQSPHYWRSKNHPTLEVFTGGRDFRVYRHEHRKGGFADWNGVENFEDWLIAACDRWEWKPDAEREALTRVKPSPEVAAKMIAWADAQEKAMDTQDLRAIRLECLKLAVANGPSRSQQDQQNEAQAYLDWVMQTEAESAPETQGGDGGAAFAKAMEAAGKVEPVKETAQWQILENEKGRISLEWEQYQIEFDENHHIWAIWATKPNGRERLMNEDEVHEAQAWCLRHSGRVEAFK